MSTTKDCQSRMKTTHILGYYIHHMDETSVSRGASEGICRRLLRKDQGERVPLRRTFQEISSGLLAWMEYLSRLRSLRWNSCSCDAHSFEFRNCSLCCEPAPELVARRAVSRDVFRLRPIFCKLVQKWRHGTVYICLSVS